MNAGAGHSTSERRLPLLPRGFQAALAAEIEWLRRHHDAPSRAHFAGLEVGLTLLIAGVILLVLLACLYVLSLALAPRPHFAPTVTSSVVRP